MLSTFSIFDKIKESQNLTVYYEYYYDPEKGWKDFNLIPGKYYKDLGLWKLMRDLIAYDYVILGGWSNKWNIVIAFYLYFKGRKFAFFSDYPEKKKRSFLNQMLKKCLLTICSNLFVACEAVRPYYVNNYNENQWFDPFGFNRANIFRKNTYTQKYSDTFYLACGKYCSYITVSFEFEIPEDETFDISKFKLYETNYEYCDGENENWINPMIAVYNDNLVLAGSCDDIDIYNEYDNYFLAFDNQTSLINLNDWTPARLNFSDPCTICDCKYEISKTSNEDEAKEIFEWYKKSNDKDTTIEFIRKNQDNINWNCISDNIRNYPIEFIREFKDMLDWDKVTMAIFKYDDSTESMTADLNFFKEFKVYIRPWFIINVPDIDKNILIELLKLFEGPFSRLCDERWTLFNETQTFNSEEDEYIQKLKSK